MNVSGVLNPWSRPSIPGVVVWGAGVGLIADVASRAFQFHPKAVVVTTVALYSGIAGYRYAKLKIFNLFRVQRTADSNMLSKFVLDALKAATFAGFAVLGGAFALRAWTYLTPYCYNVDAAAHHRG